MTKKRSKPKPKYKTEMKTVAVNAMEPDPDNPNVQELPVFNTLVEGMKEFGVLEPVLVVPLGKDKYRIVSGEHRWRAAQAANIEEMDAVIVTGLNEATRKMLLVRMNVTKGKIDPEKFTKLWNKLKKSHSEDELRKKMGFSGRDVELKRLIKEVGDALPESAKDDFEARADRIRSGEDRLSVVQSLFSRYGETVPLHFVMFAYGGKTHLMVEMDSKQFDPIRKFAAQCSENKVDLAKALSETVKDQLVEKEKGNGENQGNGRRRKRSGKS